MKMWQICKPFCSWAGFIWFFFFFQFNLQVFIKLMRRYKYLEKMFEEEMKKVLIFIKGFTPSERTKLARMTALWIGE